MAAAGSFTQAFTIITLNGIGSSRLEAFSHLTYPAMLSHQVAGNVSYNGWNTPISFAETVPALAHVSRVDLPEAQCNYYVVNANASTSHLAGFQVKGVGLVTARERSVAQESCKPPCNNDMLAPLYDPWSPEVDCDTSGSSGSGGGSSMKCHQEWIVVEISYDGGRTWSVLWQGYASVCA